MWLAICRTTLWFSSSFWIQIVILCFTVRSDVVLGCCTGLGMILLSISLVDDSCEYIWLVHFTWTAEVWVQQGRLRRTAAEFYSLICFTFVHQNLLSFNSVSSLFHLID
jgi:hypothetical protein